MSILDRERIAAIATPKELGYTVSLSGWSLTPGPFYITEGGATHAALVRQTDEVAGCADG